MQAFRMTRIRREAKFMLSAVADAAQSTVATSVAYHLTSQRRS
ncbi:MAG: hypothetical protein ACOYMK_17850 [Hyphomonadaceae bacterium]